MIAFVKGNLIEVKDNKAILEVNGIGYNVFVTANDAEQLPRIEGDVLLHTYLQVREDAMQLFGFLRRDDMEVFQMLLGVNGIGPKAALGVLSAFSANDLRFAVLAGDSKTIAKAPGIGNKTAQKLILELKDKFNLMEAFEAKLSDVSPVSDMSDRNCSEAVQALVALGYPSSEALKAVRAAAISEEMSTEEILKAALKKMSF